MRQPTVVALLLAALAGLVWAAGPSAGERAARQADLVALLDGTDHVHPEAEAPPASGPGVLVVDLVDGSGDAALEAIEAKIGADLDWLNDLARVPGLAIGTVPDLAAAMDALDGMAGIEAVEPEVEVSAMGWPDDPLYARQWNLPVMGAEAAWRDTPRGAGIIVAVIDTGVSPVEDLDAARVLPGASFVPGVSSAADDNGHGTHVAGTIAQSTNNGIGVAGVAPAAIILPVKVLSRFGGGTSAQVAAGIDYAVAEGAQVINLSLGGGLYSRVIHIAIRKARKSGVLVFAAAGNDGRKRVSWPGALPEAIGVSATGPDGRLAPYSNQGKGVDLSAPGGDKRVPGGGILQDTVDGAGHAYKEFQGTSMATPHAAGAAAALLSTGFLDADAVERVLLASADGASWEPAHGWGRLDVGGALDLLGGTDAPARFGLGLLFALLLSGLSGAGLWFRLASAFVGGVAAGGIFHLGALPGLPAALLSRGLLDWPVVFLGPIMGPWLAWVGFLAPLGIAFLLGPMKWTRPVALGAAAGVGAHLVHGLVYGAFAPWWFPSSVVTTWFGVQIVVCLLTAMALAGVERLDRRAAEA